MCQHQVENFHQKWGGNASPVKNSMNAYLNYFNSEISANLCTPETENIAHRNPVGFLFLITAGFIYNDAIHNTKFAKK